VSFQRPDEVVLNLVDKLGTDDAFRTRFADDPRAALATLGFGPASDPDVTSGIWACMTVTQLASKEAILGGRAQLVQQLTARGVYSPFHLEGSATVLRAA
jgi:putative modified peptide